MSGGGRPAPCPLRAAPPAARARPCAPIAAACLVPLLAAFPGPAEAQDWLETTTTRQASSEDSVAVRVEYGAGRFTLEPGGPDLLYRARIRYDSERFRPLRDYSRVDGTARVRLGLGSRGDGKDFDWSDLGDLSLGDLDDLDDSDFDGSRMELQLGRRVPVDLDVAIGAAESTLRLGGVPLTGLSLTTGASETRVRFDEPNPARMDRLVVRSGAASLDVVGLGNAAARRMRFESGVGELTLDFTGRWTRDAEVSVKMGVGELRLRVPRDLGVQVRKSTLLSSFSALGFEKVGDRYRTENWDEADHHLELQIDAAFGSIDVTVVR